jgi:hypothetical protein
MDYQGIGFLGYRPFSGLQIRAPYRLAVTDYRRMRSAVERILDWDFEQIIVGHGAVVDKNGKEVFRREFRWLFW